MIRVQRFLRALLFVASTCLVANDCVRLVLSFDPPTFMVANNSDQGQEEESNPLGPNSIFEEEVKHKHLSPSFSFELAAEDGLEVSVAHLIKDDDVRHLAYLAIFSPPPDLA